MAAASMCRKLTLRNMGCYRQAGKFTELIVDRGRRGAVFFIFLFLGGKGFGGGDGNVWPRLLFKLSWPEGEGKERKEQER